MVNVRTIPRARVRVGNVRGRTLIIGRIPQDQTRVVLLAETFAQRLRRLRTERGLTQHQLAALTDLHRVTVSDCEGDRPGVTAHTVALLARALGVTMHALWHGEAS